MRIAVVGAGAIGRTVAAALAHKHDTTLVGRPGAPPTWTPVAGLPGAIGVPALADSAAGADLVFIATKWDGLEAACRDAAAQAAADAIGVPLLNGLAPEAVAARYFARVAGGVTAIEAEWLGGDEAVRVGKVGGLVFGGPDGDLSAATIASLQFVGSAIASSLTADLHGARWTKLLMNLNNAITAATGTTVGEALARRDVARVAVMAMREASAVARAEGATLRPIPWANPRLITLLTRLPLPVAATVLSRKVAREWRGEGVMGSTLQSIKRGRPTEVAHLNGEVVRRADALGLEAPVNRALVQLVEEVSKRGGPVTCDELAARALA